MTMKTSEKDVWIAARAKELMKASNVICNCNGPLMGTDHSPDCAVVLEMDDCEYHAKAEWYEAHFDDEEDDYDGFCVECGATIDRVTWFENDGHCEFCSSGDDDDDPCMFCDNDECDSCQSDGK